MFSYRNPGSELMKGLISKLGLVPKLGLSHLMVAFALRPHKDNAGSQHGKGTLVVP